MLDDSKHRTDEIILTEGYATGVSVNVATDKPVAVTFDAGNLEPVARALREKYPEAQITICADNDHETGGTETAPIHTKVRYFIRAIL